MQGHWTRGVRITILVVLVVLGVTSIGVAGASAATTLNVTTTADIAATAGACGNAAITTPPSPLSLREAVCLANNIGGTVTINIPAGTYGLDNGEIQPGLHTGQTVNLIGAGTASTLINGESKSRVIEYDLNLVGDVHGTVSGLTIENGYDDHGYGGGGMIGGSYEASVPDSMTVTGVDFSNNSTGAGNPRAVSDFGGAFSFGGGNVTITHSSFENNTGYSNLGSAMWYAPYGPTANQTLTMSDVTFTGNHGNNSNTDTSGTIPPSGGALALGDIATDTHPTNHTGVYNVSDTRFINNTFVSSGTGGAVGAGILIDSDTLNLTGSTFSGNTVSNSGGTGTLISGAAVYSRSPATAVLRDNRFVGNTAPDATAVTALSGSTIDARDNWWGCNAGPGQSGCDAAGSGVTTSPWLTFSAAPSSPTAIAAHGTSTMSAGFTRDSSGATITNPDFGGWSLPVSWGSASPSDASVSPSSSTLGSNGLATATFTAGTTTGTGSATATADGTTATPTVLIAAPPTVTGNPSDTSAPAGTTATFTASASGTPAPTVQWQKEPPGGSSFSNIAGATSTTYSFTTSQSDDGSQYRAVFTNAGGSVTTSAATLSVGTPPSFTSAGTTTFTAGQDGSFTVTAGGNPAPTITAPNALPSWLSFSGGSGGQGTLSGHPPAGSGGTYSIPLHAANGVSPAADQTLTLTVDEAPAVTGSPSDASVTAGSSVSFTASASGYPAPSVQWQRDTGSGFSNISGATSTTYAFTASQSDSGNRYRAVFSNGVGSPATTSAATLTVGTPPSFTSANATTFTTGQAGTFTVSASGPPAPGITTTTSLPSWLTLGASSGGQATLSGTPPAGSGGTYSIALHADNTFAPAADQTFTLTVDEQPVITTNPSDQTVQPGDAVTFTAAATGYPAPSVQWQRDTGSGFADITGATSTSYSFNAAASDRGNRYRAVFSNVAGSTPTSAATLTVQKAPAFTSPAAATFDVGQDGSATVQTSGVPDATVTTTSTLPSWLTLTAGSGGSATLSGHPPTGSGGNYAIDLQADNGVDPAATQQFTLTVDEPPAITSAGQTTFTIGDSGSFTVTSRGYPAPAITETGALPSGLTLTDHHDGTASLSGTPAAGTAGDHPIVVHSDSGSGSDSASLDITVLKRAQAITVTSAAPDPAVAGGSEPLSAHADSGLPVDFSLDAGSSGCSLTGSTLHFDHGGTCLVDYDQSGDGTWWAAPRVQQRITIVAHASSVQVTAAPNPTVYGQAATANAAVTIGGAPGSGSVRFAVDGAALGPAVTLSGGRATSPPLTDGSGQPLAPGSHAVTAAYVPADATTDAPASGSTTQTVDQAASALTLAVSPHTLSATAAAVAPGTGTPGGTVSFRVGGRPVGDADLRGGVATLTYTAAPGTAQSVAAVYGGDPDFTGSTASAARLDPTITASVTGARRSRSGWYRAPVTVRFDCTTHGAPLAGGCPAPVTLTRNGGGQSVTRSVLATDGGAASATVRGIDIDRRPPVVSAAGVRQGAQYASPPRLRCVARDSVSGVSSCRLSTHRRGDTVLYRLVATDVAGNVATVSGQYRLVAVSIAGLRPVGGVYTVVLGRTYTLVAHSTRRPGYIDAAVAPGRPSGFDRAMYAAGRDRWTLGVTMRAPMRAHERWNLGVRIGSTLKVLPIRVIGR